MKQSLKIFILSLVFLLAPALVSAAPYPGPEIHPLPYSGYTKAVVFPKSNGEWWAIYYNGADVQWQASPKRVLFDNSDWSFSRIYPDYSFEDNGVLGSGYFDVDNFVVQSDLVSYISAPSAFDPAAIGALVATLVTDNLIGILTAGLYKVMILGALVIALYVLFKFLKSWTLSAASSSSLTDETERLLKDDDDKGHRFHQH